MQQLESQIGRRTGWPSSDSGRRAIQAVDRIKHRAVSAFSSWKQGKRKRRASGRQRVRGTNGRKGETRLTECALLAREALPEVLWQPACTDTSGYREGYRGVPSPPSGPALPHPQVTHGI